jgi:Domain of unknown function (DUF222)
MTSHPTEPRDTVDGVGVPAELARIRTQVRGLTDTLWAARSRHELMDTVAEIEAFKSTLEFVELGVVRELDATNAVKTTDWASTQNYLTTVADGHKGTGPATVRLATVVDQPLLAPVGEALRDGWLSAAKAQVIQRGIDALPGNPVVRARGVRLIHAGPRTIRREGPAEFTFEPPPETRRSRTGRPPPEASRSRTGRPPPDG